MASVQGIKEKVHSPIYDSVHVEPEKQLRDTESSNTLKFFVNVQGKTKLETNLQSASLLPHYNTFEARAMRVIVSDLPPEFSEEVDGTMEELEVTGDNNAPIADVTATVAGSLKQLMELLDKARNDNDETEIDWDDEDLDISFDGGGTPPSSTSNPNSTITLSVDDLEQAIRDIERSKGPPEEQIRPNDGAGNLIGKLVYNTVTTFYVGEKVMIEMPTWFFPGGAGPYSFTAKNISHGEPSPLATFRFAEPIFIDRQQNFRVEIEVPDADTLKEIQKIYGPMFIWVVLDGYMTRDVQ
jgi:hypothetical protein